MSVACVLPPAPESVSAARRFVTESLTGLPDDTLHAAALVVSELATNCVLHAGSEFRISVQPGTARIRIEVSDSGGGNVRLRHPTPSEAHGRGLQIVDALADAWGTVIDPADGHKTVWFILTVD